jgi:hypothetical protein
MKRLMPRYLLLTALLCHAVGTSVLAAERSHLLDGMTFAGWNAEKGQTQTTEAETITFADGLFTSVSCEPYNFDSSEYSTRVEGERVYFEAVTHSPSHGQIAWSGVIEGEEADVTFVWTKERWYWDTRREYWFKGRLKR